MSTFAIRTHRRHADEPDAEGTWAVSYGDMITLLLTFFIVFFTIDPKAANKQNERLKISLIDSLKNTSSSEIYQGVQNELAIGKDTKKGVDREILKSWNGVVHDRGNYLIVEFPAISFFDSAKTELTKKGSEALAEFVKVYTPYAGNYQIGIRAFADHRQVMPRARFKDNLELSALRSVSTMRTLQKAGIPLSRIKLGGYGETVATAQDLQSIPKESRSPSVELGLARKVVLVIEPEVIK